MRLGIDYGTQATRAVLTWPDGRWVGLLFDGSPQLPSGVYLDTDATVWTGVQALHLAAGDPARYLAHPKRHARQPAVAMDSRHVEVVDLIAATLRRVGAEATRVAGQPADELTLTVPASWGPRRRALLRRAATRAGLPQPHLVDTPIGVAAHLLATGVSAPAGAAILVCDVGAGRFEATVVSATGDGFEVLSVIESTDAAGLAADAALADHVATITAGLPRASADPGPTGPTVPPGAAHAAIQALTHTAAVAVPTTSGTAVVIDQPTLHTLTRPVLAHAHTTAQAAIAAADLTPDALAGVYCCGGGIPPPLAADALTGGPGPHPVVVPDPELAALLGAVAAHGHPTGPPAPPTPPGTPRAGHYAAAVIPAVASMALLLQATTTALPITDPQTIDRTLFVIANWGEYALAGLLALQAALAAAVLAAAHLAGKLQRADPDTPTDTGRLLSRFLPAAATVGVSLAGLYAILAALWHGVPDGPFLRTTLLAATPAAAAATAVGLLAGRRPRAPAATWLDWLTTTPLAPAGAAAGMWLIQFGYTTTDPATAGLRVPGMYLGAALVGIAIAFTLPIPRGYQVLAAAPLALTAAVLTTGHATGTLAALYTLAVTGHHLTRATQLALTNNTGAAAP